MEGITYAPVLKWKRGEQQAVSDISSDVKKSLLPLIELIAPDDDSDKDPSDYALKQISALEARWGTGHRLLLDLGAVSESLGPDLPNGLAAVLKQAEDIGLQFVPVIGLKETPQAIKALKNHTSRGVCLRVTIKDLVSLNISDSIATLLEALKITKSDVDVVVDLKSIVKYDIETLELLAPTLLDRLPSLKHWRTIAMTGSAFPESMAGIPGRSATEIHRVEWKLWQHLRNLGDLPRTPIFGDYAIQHPVLMEGFDPTVMRMSAAIRYTSQSSWIIVKGTNVFQDGWEQVRELCQQLMQHPAYCGETHCAGCKRIAEVAMDKTTTGNASTWRYVGTVHHLTLVVEQLAKLTVPSTGV